MKKYLSLLFAFAALFGLYSAPTLAQSMSAMVQVSAVVPKVCRFISTTALLTIGHNGGEIDPLSTQDATGTSSLDYFCGQGVQVEFSTEQLPTEWGIGKAAVTTLTRSGGTETMTAAVTINNLQDAPIGQGYDVPLSVSLMGRLGASDFSTVPAGTYAGTQTFNIRGQP